MVSFENLGKIKKVYKMYIADSIVHIEEFPVVYVNRKVLYCVDHGGDDLIKVYIKNILLTDEDALERAASSNNISFDHFSKKFTSYNNYWFLNRTSDKDSINKKFSESDISRMRINRIKTELADKVNRKRNELYNAVKEYEDYCKKNPD